MLQASIFTAYQILKITKFIFFQPISARVQNRSSYNLRIKTKQKPPKDIFQRITQNTHTKEEGKSSIEPPNKKDIFQRTTQKLPDPETQNREFTDQRYPINSLYKATLLS
jgi:hypothetical protein